MSYYIYIHHLSYIMYYIFYIIPNKIFLFRRSSNASTHLLGATLFDRGRQRNYRLSWSIANIGNGKAMHAIIGQWFILGENLLEIGGFARAII